jgi:glycosyltransferase involved in cell wall biosynthesis
MVFRAAARAAVVERFRVAEERVHALPVGCDHWRRELATPLPRDEPPTVLVLGRIDHRRAPVAILRACERLRASGAAVQLAFVGRHGDAYDELRARATRSPIVGSVRFTSEPRESEMPATVARASVLVHLSDGELSPVTPLEALDAGCAVVASRLPAFEEALGVHARWIDERVDAVDIDALASALAAALDDARDIHGREARRALASRFTWSRHAALTLDVWRTILSP